VIQAYLYRSEWDVHRLVGQRIPVRLCKGAYDEPDSIAFRRKADVDENFVKLMKILLKSGLLPGIATHDERMIDATIRFAETEGISPGHFEFQMLYGVRRDLQRELVARGYDMRVYTPFGTEWYPYFMRRIAERPANALFVAKSLFRG
jgi:proline dehydrogenase